MSEQPKSPIQETPISAEAQSKPLSKEVIAKAKRDLSFFLKQPPHDLPKASVDRTLDEFARLAKQSRPNNSLAAVLEELAALASQTAAGKLSPRYLAIVDFAQKNCGAEGRVSGTNLVEETPQAQAAAVSETTDATAQAVTGVFTIQEAPSAVRRKLPNIMDIPDFGEAIKAVFPSISGVLVEAIRSKMTLGPTQEEQADPNWDALNWQENYLTAIIARVPALANDLENLDATVGSVARLLFARGQKETSQAEVAQSVRRGKLETLAGISSDDLKLMVRTERAIAGKPLSTAEELAARKEEGSPATDGTAPAATADSGSTQPPSSGDAVAADLHARPTVTNEASLGSELPTREIKVDEVEAEVARLKAAQGQKSRGKLATEVGMDASLVAAEVAAAAQRSSQEPPQAAASDEASLPFAERTTLAPGELPPVQPADTEQKRKKKKKGFLSGLFGGDDKKDGEK